MCDIIHVEVGIDKKKVYCMCPSSLPTSMATWLIYPLSLSLSLSLTLSPPSPFLSRILPETLPHCSVCHVPYSITKQQSTQNKVYKCAVCRYAYIVLIFMHCSFPSLSLSLSLLLPPPIYPDQPWYHLFSSLPRTFPLD